MLSDSNASVDDDDDNVPLARLLERFSDEVHAAGDNAAAAGSADDNNEQHGDDGELPEEEDGAPATTTDLLDGMDIVNDTAQQQQEEKQDSRAGSSTDPPPPPPPPPPSKARTARVDASYDRFYFLKNGGEIRAYPVTRTCDAVCPNKKHGKCIMSRTMVRADKGTWLFRNPFGGRPLGKLAYFLMDADNPAYKTKAQHLECMPNYEERLAAREMLKADPDAAGLFTYERQELDSGETEEPSFFK